MRACMAQAVPRVKAPIPNLGRPAQAGAVFVDGVSSAVELALVMRTRNGVTGDAKPARIGGGRQGSLPNLRPARGTTAPCIFYRAPGDIVPM